MPSAVANLLSILDLEQLELNLFRGQSPKVGWQRVFGGQVIGQALVAASRTVDGRAATFAARLFHAAGRSRRFRSSTRSIASGTDAASRPAGWSASSTVTRSSPCRRRTRSTKRAFRINPRCRMSPVPSRCRARRRCRASSSPRCPSPCAPITSVSARSKCGPWRSSAICPKRRCRRFHVWIRATGPLPDDPEIHQAVLAYASDMTLLDTSLMPHGQTVFDKSIQAASLDHALWFHRPFRADEWLLYAQDTPSASGARGFSRGSIYKQDGTLVASVAQEGLVRIAETELPLC